MCPAPSVMLLHWLDSNQRFRDYETREIVRFSTVRYIQVYALQSFFQTVLPSSGIALFYNPLLFFGVEEHAPFGKPAYFVSVQNQVMHVHR